LNNDNSDHAVVDDGIAHQGIVSVYAGVARLNMLVLYGIDLRENAGDDVSLTPNGLNVANGGSDVNC